MKKAHQWMVKLLVQREAYLKHSFFFIIHKAIFKM